jgi:chromosome segregation ATPase
MKPVILLVTVLLLTACSPYLRGPRSGAGPSKAGPLPTSPEAETLDRHLAALEAQIAKLERDLGKGRGAYRDGSLLRVEGKQGGEPPLDRLRRLERELADAEARIAARDQRVTELSRELATARDQGRSLSEQAGDLSYAKDALVTAQQALSEARSKADGLLAQLTASELQRLKAEREQFRFAAKLLKLVPGQTTQLLELQDEARESARALDGRGDERPQAKPPAATARPATPAAAPAAEAHGAGHH